MNLSQASFDFMPRHATPVAREPRPGRADSFLQQVTQFSAFGKKTQVLRGEFEDGQGRPVELPVLVNEFWTARQRQAHSLHEISYRACFKPQLPRFFIERLSQPGEVVYDPFMGRGTTLLEAALLGRVPAGCDVNPLSTVLLRPRLRPPLLEDLGKRLREIDFTAVGDCPEDLLVFFHRDTLAQISALREYFLARSRQKNLDPLDEWVRMVAVNRLTGHSPGFFSVYTLPPNQAVSLRSQIKINAKRNQSPPRRSVPDIVFRKSRLLLSDCCESTRKRLLAVEPKGTLLTGNSASTPQLAARSVSLVVTSPPFLNVVDYATDNWLRCWFVDIDSNSVKLTVPRRLEVWQEAMTSVFRELHRVLAVGGHIAFEVGEVHAGKTLLEQAVVPCGMNAGLKPVCMLINAQKFTKTANCWGVDNNSKGTNSNRIVVFQK